LSVWTALTKLNYPATVSVAAGRQSEGSLTLTLTLTTTSINMAEPQPHDSQNRIICFLRAVISAFGLTVLLNTFILLYFMSLSLAACVLE